MSAAQRVRKSPCRAGWGTCLEDDVAFGVKDESAHIGDDRAAAEQQHAQDQADVGFGALDQVDDDQFAVDLPEGDPVSEKRPSMLPWTWTRMGLPAASYRTWMVRMPPKAGP